MLRVLENEAGGVYGKSGIDPPTEHRAVRSDSENPGVKAGNPNVGLAVLKKAPKAAGILRQSDSGKFHSITIFPKFAVGEQPKAPVAGGARAEVVEREIGESCQS